MGRPVAAVTVVASTGSSPRDAGAKMLVVSGGDFFGTIGGGHLEELAIADALKSLDSGQSQLIRYPLGARTGQCCGGVVDLFFEVLNRGPRLYLFGAGHVGQAVARTFVGTPFVVHVIDERPEWISQLPREVIAHETEWDDFVKDAQWNERDTYVAVMTHRHDTDQAIIEKLLERPYRYLGLIGSHSKWERFKQRFEARGIAAEKFERVQSPLGLDLGAGKAPQEIAISLAAELLKIHYSE